MCDCHSCSVCVCDCVVSYNCVYYKIGHSGKPLDQGCVCVSSLYNSESQKKRGGGELTRTPHCSVYFTRSKTGGRPGNKAVLCVCGKN